MNQDYTSYFRDSVRFLVNGLKKISKKSLERIAAPKPVYVPEELKKSIEDGMGDYFKENFDFIYHNNGLTMKRKVVPGKDS